MAAPRQNTPDRFGLTLPDCGKFVAFALGSRPIAPGVHRTPEQRASVVSRWRDAMNMTRWDPFRELEEMHGRVNRLLGQSTHRGTTEEGESFADWAPALDVEESDREYLVKADLPAVKKEDVKVSLEDGVLAIEGERKQEKEEKGKKFHRIERSYGKFVRRLAVPTDADPQKVSAEFKDGVLNVHLPKSPAAKPRSIDVKVS
jgi:HSP20 family protein